MRRGSWGAVALSTNHPVAPRGEDAIIRNPRRAAASEMVMRDDVVSVNINADATSGTVLLLSNDVSLGLGHRQGSA